MIKKKLTNNQIRSPQVRVIDETEKQLGVISLEKALQISRERNLDLIQITEKVEPPVCKIMDYGKYLYIQKKKTKIRKPQGELKKIRLSFNISVHDLETRANLAKNFLEQGNKVRIELQLRGRQKALTNFAKEKMNKFLENLGEIISFKVEKELKREPRGLTILISKQ
ncbi:MAG: translation initiation factor IF-3 [Patescibacteria group bacterium]|nr:translation initiation factor IF-3 [Patescibacteria group bacterium]